MDHIEDGHKRYRMTITSVLYNECFRRRCVTKKCNAEQVDFYNNRFHKEGNNAFVKRPEPTTLVDSYKRDFFYCLLVHESHNETWWLVWNIIRGSAFSSERPIWTHSVKVDTRTQWHLNTIIVKITFILLLSIWPHTSNPALSSYWNNLSVSRLAPLLNSITIADFFFPFSWPKKHPIYSFIQHFSSLSWFLVTWK